MAKESYNVEDILSEVKKRREENETQIRSKGDEKAKTASQKRPNQQAKRAPQNRLEQKPAKAQRTVSREVKSNPNDAQRQNSQEVKVYNEAPKEQTSTPKRAPQQSPQPQAPKKQNKTTRSRAVPREEYPEVVDNMMPETGVVPQQQEQMVDLFSLANQDVQTGEASVQAAQVNTAKIPWRKTKKGKITVRIIIALVVLIIAAAVAGFLYLNGMLNSFTDNTDDYKPQKTYTDMDNLVEDFPSIEEMDASEVTSYREYLKQWYENGDPVSSTHIKNILLIGEDTRDSKISDTSRADSAIIVSINIDTQQITMTSILRDLYVYYEVDGEGRYGKINAAASEGGMKTYIQTVERYYKMQIENYFVVNFASFPKIVDSMGGVSINITSAEIYEINNHPKRYGNVVIDKTFDGNEGKLKLDGKQALAYCRIRKIDSDGARADRQKTVLMQLFNQLKGSSTLDTAKVVNDLIGYVKTGYSKKELVSIGSYGLKKGWLDYKINTTTVPSAEHAKGGSFMTSNGGYMYGGWIWKSDIPKDAYDLQMKIYGKSSITLSENRADYCNIA